jgi:hypothetical protein
MRMTRRTGRPQLLTPHARLGQEVWLAVWRHAVTSGHLQAGRAAPAEYCRSVRVSQAAIARPIVALTPIGVPAKIPASDASSEIGPEPASTRGGDKDVG